MHDGFALSFSVAELEDKIDRFISSSTREEAKQLFGTLCNPQQWDYTEARKILASGRWRWKISRIWVAPFDLRYTVYDRAVAVHLRRRLCGHFFKRQNIGLVIGGAGQEITGDEWDAVCCVDDILQLNYFRRNGSPTLPLYLYGDNLLAGTSAADRRPNFGRGPLREILGRLGMDGEDGRIAAGICPDDIFQYAYSVLHSPAYRNRYADFLKADFPRLPLTSDRELFRDLARLGGELVALHLVKAPVQQVVFARYDRIEGAWRYEVGNGPTLPLTLSFNGPDKPVLGKVGWSDDTVWIDAAKPKRSAADPKVTGTVGFRGVPEEVWNFHIGGYQVCEKWLKDRRGRTLAADDITHYYRIVIALHETIRIMREIDEVIEAHGGWPGAFQPAGAASSEMTEARPEQPELVSAHPARERSH